MGKTPTSLIPVERIEQSILLIRGQKVMLDNDLASLYGVETKILNRAVRRNADRFPEDFAFQLNEEEFENLRCHFGTSSSRGGRRYAPYAFTEQGVAMLSSVLRSPRAVAVNVEIMRTLCPPSADARLTRRPGAKARRPGKEVRRSVPSRLRRHPPTHGSGEERLAPPHWVSIVLQ